MRYLLNFDRVLICLMGVVWILQGLGLLPGELMHGHIFWSFAGAVLIAIEGGLMYFSIRRMRA
jgi:hypothetical protein